MGFAAVSLVVTLGVVVELKHFALIIAIVAMVAAICLGFFLCRAWDCLVWFGLKFQVCAVQREVRSDGIQWLVWSGECGKYRCGAKLGKWEPIKMGCVDSFLI